MSQTKNITVLHGPNLNLLGVRDPDQYGTMTLADINEQIKARCAHHRLTVAIFQCNSEGDCISVIHGARDSDGLLINPGAYAHTSLAIADALACVDAPIVEVHLSNVHARDAMRHRMLTASQASGVITGLRHNSYVLGVDALVQLMEV